ncbi:hypothetical protein HMPREF9129_1921 [Peptoniphilus indolicus ATCC 29427]|uniref:Uncharacterized protein n=1 Tax=Peptoniphilus indolicus ATCC 29427 TaxID=997350 RepID=G4D691_9FIRM|nr:hypothetical protein HMPREF9129_1921 [Peptoniphilus indolicus ATCC 29427]
MLLNEFFQLRYFQEILYFHYFLKTLMNKAFLFDFHLFLA